MFGRIAWSLSRGAASNVASSTWRARWRAKSSQAGQTSGSRLVHPVIKAAITSAGFSALGDVLAQVLTQSLGPQRRAEEPAPHLDLTRVARMFGFGLFFYGPYQHYWYNLLDWRFPTKSPQHFLSKVFLNQTVLAPVVLTVVFTWNLLLTGQASQITCKIQNDLVPTMINASLNFYVVPLQHQVLYMSTCSVLWTAYLSYMSYANMAPAKQ